MGNTEKSEAEAIKQAIEEFHGIKVKQPHEQTPEMTSGVLRQRRNLLATCVILLILKLSGASFGEISFIGTNIKGLNNSEIVLGLWAMCAYFCYRCFVYTINEDGFNATIRPWRNAVVEYFEKHIKVLAEQKGYDFTDGADFASPSADEAKRIIDFQGKYYISKIDDQNNKGTEIENPAKFIKIGLLGYKAHFRNLNILTGEYREIMPSLFVSFYKMRNVLLPILGRMFFKKKEFSDYMFPFLLFLVTSMVYMRGWLPCAYHWLKALDFSN